MTCEIIAACAGHVHAYERNYQTYNYNLQGCAPRWITMGRLTHPAAKVFLPWQICTADVWAPSFCFQGFHVHQDSCSETLAGLEEILLHITGCLS